MSTEFYRKMRAMRCAFCEENAADSVVDIVNRGTVQKLLFSSGKMAEIQFSEEKCSIEIQ